MMMGYYSGTLYVCTFWIGFLLTCVFLCSAQECIGFLGGNKKGGVYVGMFAQRDFSRLDGKFISSIFSQQDIYIYIPHINHPVE